MENEEHQNRASRSTSTKNKLRSVLRDNKGLNTVEYAILLALIVMVAFVSWQEIGKKLGQEVDKAKTKILTIQ